VINDFLQKGANADLSKIAYLASGYYQLRASQKENYDIKLDANDIQVLPICKAFYEFYESSLETAIIENTNLAELQQRILRIKENLNQ